MDITQQAQVEIPPVEEDDDGGFTIDMGEEPEPQLPDEEELAPEQFDVHIGINEIHQVVDDDSFVELVSDTVFTVPRSSYTQGIWRTRTTRIHITVAYEEKMANLVRRFHFQADFEDMEAPEFLIMIAAILSSDKLDAIVKWKEKPNSLCYIITDSANEISEWAYSSRLPLSSRDIAGRSRRDRFRLLKNHLQDWYRRIRNDYHDGRGSDENDLFEEETTNVLFGFALQMLQLRAPHCVTNAESDYGRLLKNQKRMLILVPEGLECAPAALAISMEVNDIPLWAAKLWEECSNQDQWIELSWTLAATKYGLEISVWTKTFDGSCFYVRDIYNPGGPTSCHVYQSGGHCEGLALNKKGYPLIASLELCRVCYLYYTHGSPHFISCRRCECQFVYQAGASNHTLYCRFAQQHQTEHELGEIKRYKKDTSLEGDHIFFADFEAFTQVNGTQVVYAASYAKLGGTPVTKIGPKALSWFVKRMLKYNQKGIWYFYNGSAYDFIFIIKEWLLTRPALILQLEDAHDDYVRMKGRRFISLKLKLNPAVELRDLLLLLSMMRLEEAAKAFSPADAQKGDFDHSKVTCWSDVIQHREEIQHYLEADVNATKGVFLGLRELMWNNFSINIAKFTTQAQLAYAVWGSTLPHHIKIFKSKPEEYEIHRAALYGGRVLPVKTHFISQQWEWIQDIMHELNYIPQETFDNVTDYLVHVDQSSQYPYCMKHYKYPIGRSRVITPVENYLEGFTAHNDEVAEFQMYLLTKTQKERVRNTIWRVDVIPPKDLLIPYLFHRDNGKLGNDLLPHKSQTYTGVDIWRANKLGYMFPKIYFIMVWDETDDLFTEYIDKCYNGKSTAPRGGGAYMLFKILMNGLSGKFGQRIIDESCHITPTELLKQLGGFALEDRNIAVINNGTGDNIGALIKRELPAARRVPHYAAYISAFITSYARSHMLKILARYDGHKRHDRGIWYTDTDSFIMHKRTLPHFERYMGDALGLFGHEFGANAKIIYGLFLGKKTYFEAYIKDQRLWAKVRCKGIPHTNAAIDIYKEKEVSAEWLKKMIDVLEGRDTYVDLRRKCYVSTSTVDETAPAKVYSYLTLECFEEAYEGTSEIVCHYGSLQRTLAGKAEGFTLRPVFASRRLIGNEEMYWNRRVRFFADDDTDRINSYPLGYEFPT